MSHSLTSNVKRTIEGPVEYTEPEMTECEKTDI